MARQANVSDSNLTYTSILYGNGPGGLKKIRTHNLTNDVTSKKTHENYRDTKGVAIMIRIII